MKIGIIGAGALGLLFGAKLQKDRLENSYYLITRTKDQKDKIITNGITLETNGKKERISINAFKENQTNEALDWVFLMVKQPQLKGIEPTLLKWINSNTKILAFQNGLGHFEQLRKMVKNPIFLAVTTEGAYKKSCSHVIHTGKGETFIGSPDRFEIPEELINFLNEAGFKTIYSENILEKVWRKLIINAAVNPLSAIFEIRNGQLLDNEEIKDLMKRIIVESTNIAKAEGIILGENMEKVVEQVCMNTSSNYSSMLQDIQMKRKTEIEAIVLELVKFGKKKNINTATLEVVAKIVKGKESLFIEKESIKFSD